MATTKTAVSVDASICSLAQRAARKTHTSRSQLYARAIGRFVERTEEISLAQSLKQAYGSHQLDDEERAFMAYGARQMANATKDDKW